MLAFRFFHRFLAGVLGTVALLDAGLLWAAPVDAGRARQVASAYAAGHQASAMAAGSTRQWAASATPGIGTGSREIVSGAGLVGFAVTQEPAGFILVRTDDDLPPVKLQVDTGTYENLPAGFRAVIEAELAGELADLAALRQAGAVPPARFHAAWQALTAPPTLAITQSQDASAAGTVLLTTKWDQGAPYNCYAPAATGGPDGRAYAGCAPCALAQILRFHQWPAAPLTDYRYQDFEGFCTGTHTLSDAGGLAAYDWESMPASVSSSSALVQRQAVGRLIYQCGVAMAADFEADGTSVYSDPDAARALRDVFGYTCDDIVSRTYFLDAAWYAKIQADIEAGHPVYYTMRTADDEGHAVVCDGYRNDREIHLNFGWSGAGNTWYNLDAVAYDGDIWSEHEAVFEITPVKAPAVPATIPTVTTAAPVATSGTTATSGGRVASSGGATVTARGVCWSTTANPTVANARTSDGNGTGAFTSALAGLDAGSAYYVRAYATNNAGTAYGEPLPVTMPVSTGPDLVVANIAITPVLPAVGSRFTAAITVQNQGSQKGKGGTLCVWANKPAAAAAGEKGDRSASISMLKPGQSKTVRVSLMAPKSRGAFTLRAFVDAKNATKEGEEDNNQETYGYDTGLPDFKIRDVRISPETPAAGKAFTAYVTVINAGGVAGNAGYLELWADRSALTATPVPGGKGNGNKSKPAGTLQPGQEKTVAVTGLKAPADQPAPVLGVLIDSRAKTQETDETNNGFEFDYNCQ